MDLLFVYGTLRADAAHDMLDSGELAEAWAYVLVLA